MTIVKRAVLCRNQDSYALFLEAGLNDNYKVYAETGARSISRGAGLNRSAANALFEQVLTQKNYEGFFTESVFESDMPSQLSEFTKPMTTKAFSSKPSAAVLADLYTISVAGQSERVIISYGVFTANAVEIFDTNDKCKPTQVLKGPSVVPFLAEAYVKNGIYQIVDLFYYGDHSVSSSKYSQRRELIAKICKQRLVIDTQFPSASSGDDPFCLSMPNDRDSVSAIRFFNGYSFPAIISSIDESNVAKLSMYTKSNRLDSFTLAKLPAAFNCVAHDIVTVGFCEESLEFVIIKPDLNSSFNQCVMKPAIQQMLAKQRQHLVSLHQTSEKDAPSNDDTDPTSIADW